MKILIITNGYIFDYEFYKRRLKNYDLVICADGGLKHAYKMGIIPEIAIGDFDSAPKDIVGFFEKKGCEMIMPPNMQEETDTEIAVNYAIKEDPNQIDIFAGTGNRFDHSLANVQLLKKGLDHNIVMRIVTENNELMVINSSIKILGNIGEGVSLIPLTNTVSGINTNGLQYPLKDGKLILGEARGVSNSMSKSIASIQIDEGLLLVAKYKD